MATSGPWPQRRRVRCRAQAVGWHYDTARVEASGQISERQNCTSRGQKPRAGSWTQAEPAYERPRRSKTRKFEQASRDGPLTRGMCLLGAHKGLDPRPGRLQSSNGLFWQAAGAPATPAQAVGTRLRRQLHSSFSAFASWSHGGVQSALSSLAALLQNSSYIWQSGVPGEGAEGLR
jgi:hypothetical protein